MKKFDNFTKPPLGAPPTYVHAEVRIRELAEAIARTAIEGCSYTGTITMWAKEIIDQCALMDKYKDSFIPKQELPGLYPNEQREDLL